MFVDANAEPLLPGWRGTTRIYYATDDFVAGAELLGFSRRYAERVQASNLAAADHVLAVSETLVEELGIVDATIPEPRGGAHRDPDTMAQRVREHIAQQFDRLVILDLPGKYCAS